MSGFGYTPPYEGFILTTSQKKPLTARTLKVICDALEGSCIEQDWLVSFGNGEMRFDLCDYTQSEVKV